MAAAHNQVGKKSEKLWRDAIMRAVNRRENGKGNPKWLDRLADTLVQIGNKGDVSAVSALKEIGDRLDGKPAQSVELGIQLEITRIERTIVDPRVIEGEFEEVVSLPMKSKT